jgi:hypothetical protein
VGDDRLDVDLVVRRLSEILARRIQFGKFDSRQGDSTIGLGGSR